MHKKIKFSLFISDLYLFSSIKSFFRFKNNGVREHSVLIIELNRVHAETAMGYTKYFLDLGYNVDIVINKYLMCSGFQDTEIMKNVNIYNFSFYTPHR